MKELVWDKTLSVEVDEIDDDHRKLVELFNLFSRALEEDAPSDYLSALFEELVACTVWHFKHEERLMIQHQYPDFEEHREEHQDLIESAKELQNRYPNGFKQVDEKELEYLEHWLTEHILVADMKLGTFLGDVL